MTHDHKLTTEKEVLHTASAAPGWRICRIRYLPDVPFCTDPSAPLDRQIHTTADDLDAALDQIPCLTEVAPIAFFEYVRRTMHCTIRRCPHRTSNDSWLPATPSPVGAAVWGVDDEDVLSLLGPTELLPADVEDRARLALHFSRLCPEHFDGDRLEALVDALGEWGHIYTYR